MTKVTSLGLTVLIFGLMVGMAVALWTGWIPIEWLASLGYSGIFVLSLVNGIAPFAGPSQVATFFAASQLSPLGVGLSAGVGGAIGELAGYGFGYFLRSAQTAEMERKIERVANWRWLRISRERSFVPLLVLAALPNPFFDPASALAGSLKISFQRYFYPVLMGKVFRHLLIAFAGYYALTFMDIQQIINHPITAQIGNAAVYILAVLLIAIVVWAVRSKVESDPDPFFLNMTFFAFAGQSVLTADLYHVTRPSGLIIFLNLLALGIVFVQLAVMKAQYSTTKEHYKTRLSENLVGRAAILEQHDNEIPKQIQDDIEHWATILVRITGIDFYPQWYQNRLRFGVRGGPREERRRQAVSILPTDKFEVKKDHITVNALEVEEDSRKWLWRGYVGVFALSWGLFIASVLYVRLSE
jgi:membrane protein YqaA with SNARE-associated domain